MWNQQLNSLDDTALLSNHGSVKVRGQGVVDWHQDLAVMVNRPFFDRQG